MEPTFYNLSCIKVIISTVHWKETLCWVLFHQIRVHLFCWGLHGETPLLVLQVCWWPSGLWLTEVLVCLQANRHLKHVNVPVERRKAVTIYNEKKKQYTCCDFITTQKKSWSQNNRMQEKVDGLANLTQDWQRRTHLNFFSSQTAEGTVFIKWPIRHSCRLEV